MDTKQDRPRRRGPSDPRLAWWARVVLLLIVAGIVLVFVVAWLLNPRDEQGRPRRMGTHQQLGIPPCTFYDVTRVPCPSCGMTTGISHLVRGDVWEAIQANAAGTILGFCAAAVGVWFAVSAATGRRLGAADYPLLLAKMMTVFLVVFFVGWGVQLAIRWVLTGSVTP
jgi:hypothetical protein